MSNAYEWVYPTQVNGGDLCGGLVKRELFAGMAMQGLLVGQPDHFAISESERRCRLATLALQAVEQADALLAELEKRGVS